MVIIGQAIIDGDCLRCSSPRAINPKRLCNKLIAKKNSEGNLSGLFRCERCHKEVEIK